MQSAMQLAVEGNRGLGPSRRRDRYGTLNLARSCGTSVPATTKGESLMARTLRLVVCVALASSFVASGSRAADSAVDD